MVCMFGVCCQTLDGANVVREARKTIKNARYEENGDEAKKVRGAVGCRREEPDGCAVRREKSSETCRTVLYGGIGAVQVE